MDKTLVGMEKSVSCIRNSQFWNPFRGVQKIFEIQICEMQFHQNESLLHNCFLFLLVCFIRALLIVVLSSHVVILILINCFSKWSLWIRTRLNFQKFDQTHLSSVGVYIVKFIWFNKFDSVLTFLSIYQTLNRMILISDREAKILTLLFAVFLFSFFLWSSFHLYQLF